MPAENSLQMLLYMDNDSASYLEMENPVLLKEQWPPIKVFKLKKIF